MANIGANGPVLRESSVDAMIEVVLRKSVNHSISLSLFDQKSSLRCGFAQEIRQVRIGNSFWSDLEIWKRPFARLCYDATLFGIVVMKLWF